MFLIRMGHVEGSLHTGDCDPTRSRFSTDPGGGLRRDFVGHRRKPGAIEAHLHVQDAGGLGGVQSLFQRLAGEGRQENAELDTRSLNDGRFPRHQQAAARIG